MSFIRTPTLRASLRGPALIARSVAKPSPVNGIKNIQTESTRQGGEGFGGSETKSNTMKLAIVTSTLLVGGAMLTMTSDPKKLANAAGKVDPQSLEIQRKTQTPPSRSP